MTDGANTAVPDLVPARMLNEFVYCPRLFYLEWVDGSWDENPDTAQGGLAHRRSDRERGSIPEATKTSDSEDPWEGQARAVTLDAPELGVIAKLDLVEGRDGEVFPVDHKKGKPRADGTPWEPEEIQIAAQVLVLRENGYRCNRGFVSFRETRTRSEVLVTEALEERVKRFLADLRETARRDHPPDPLVDSPKCPRCSLVGICLPDETQILRTASEEPAQIRRLIASRAEAAPLYVIEQGARVGISGGRVEIRKDGERLASVREIDISEVALFGGVSISQAAVRRLVGAGVPITHFSLGGWFQAITIGIEPSNIQLRIEQFRSADDEEARLELARRFVGAKIRNSRVLVRRNGGTAAADAVRELHRLARVADKARSIEILLGVEGAAAREYFRAFGRLIASSRYGEWFTFERRSRRPPRDATNAVLSFLYAVLTKECALAARRVGFDPLLGFYHRPRFGRPALALDLMEEFRPLIADSVALTLINGSRLSTGDFFGRAGTVTLTTAGRRTVLAALEQRLTTEVIHPTFGYRVTYRRALELQARLLAAHLLGDVPGYRPFVTR
ncbi:MAG: CRISPR-associated endonuclease Cas1 [Gaiellales bacterium]